jgi:hypothetical protein
VRYRRKYYATNRLSLTAPEVRQLYRLRLARRQFFYEGGLESKS